MEFGYIFERLCWLMYTSHVMWTALTNPNYFGHLTYWSLCLQSVYFTVDKGSPRAGPAICLFHGTATIGALAVMLGYTFMTVGGMYRFGSFLEWENAIGKYAGTIRADRTLPVLVAQKFYEHYWPVIVLLLDKSINRASLRSAYAGAGPLRTAAPALGMAGYLAVGSAWEQYSHSLGLGSALDVYQQPDEFKTERCLGRLGLSADGLPEDFVYNSFLKVFCIGGAGFLYWSLVPPLFKADGKAKAN